jgi:hypothetical protein
MIEENAIHITIMISQEEMEALIKLSERQRRDPKDQAAILIRRELEEYGLMPWKPDSHMPVDDIPDEL